MDYRRVNSVTRQDAYPLPQIDATLDSLTGSVFFTTLDLASRYWQVELDDDARRKQHSQPLVATTSMPFGLTNVPATFQ